MSGAMAIPDCPALHSDLREEQLITLYFEDGYTYDQISSFLRIRHGIILTVDQIKYRLAKLGLQRRGSRVESPLDAVEAAIQKEHAESGKYIGYRVLHQRLVQKHKLKVGRDVVMMLSAVTDPEGVQQRKKNKLKRRVYHSKGPDYLWHVDGYDKLKPYGFPIHGCIDGFSRRILWLHVGPSNNDPYIIAGYYLDCVAKMGGCPTILRADRGTENTNIAFIQPFLRHSDFSEEKSFMYGRSTANQRIEAWWGQLRKNAASFWIDFFKDLIATGEFDNTDETHIDCLRYSFMDLIQKELLAVAHEWNTHRIRPSSQMPGGIPDILYFLPETEGTHSYKHIVDDDSLKIAEDYSIAKPSAVCDEFSNFAKTVMQEDNISPPTNVEEALMLYKHLRNELRIH